ncbi:uncharacterized protein LOC124896202 [Capsicum annuum]|uniref:uncharacterized protein LOC124896202 n=1 Tax=Capsicum annuum TaxID=4072 RepID=UPI001FB1900A|nr:uncharacterized protein LOC124896202 [Capsicum annuum]
MVLPRARYEWMHLRFQDFKIVVEYNSVVFRIVSRLKLCGETINDEGMMEKILTNFHASNVILQQQYREKGFQKYSELIPCFLVAEQHNALLMKNHEARPIKAAPLPEVNGVQVRGQPERRQDRGHNNMRRRGNDRGWYNNLHGSWKNEYRAPKQFARLYQESFKRKRNEGGTSYNARMESHLTFRNDDKTGPSQKYDFNVEANLIMEDDDFDGLDDILSLFKKE